MIILNPATKLLYTQLKFAKRANNPTFNSPPHRPHQYRRREISKFYERARAPRGACALDAIWRHSGWKCVAGARGRINIGSNFFYDLMDLFWERRVDASPQRAAAASQLLLRNHPLPVQPPHACASAWCNVHIPFAA